MFKLASKEGRRLGITRLSGLLALVLLFANSCSAERKAENSRPSRPNGSSSEISVSAGKEEDVKGEEDAKYLHTSTPEGKEPVVRQN